MVAEIKTIGHGMRPIDEFLSMLREHGVEQLLDVRTAPGSRRNPQFGKDELPRSLAGANIAYVHLPALGGFRKLREDSPNGAWRNESFRGFADYMLTDEFQAALDTLVEMSEARSTAIMCSESVPWRCHRSLIADALTVRNIPVLHLLSPASARPHTLTPFAHLDGTYLTYPAVTEDDSPARPLETDEATGS